MSKTTTIDLDEFFAAIPPSRQRSPFDIWLEADATRAAQFWSIMEEAAERGVGIRPVLELWNARFDPCPIRHNQVRLKLNERKKRG